MDRVISLKAAIDALGRIGSLDTYADREYATEIFMNLPSAQQWIPCSERLPEEYGEYRITWTTSASKNRLIGDAEYEVTGEWDEVNERFKGEWLLDEYIKNYPNVEVLAWKPLEEPWKGEQP